MAKGQNHKTRGPTSFKTVRRNRASPSRLFKLYKHLSDDQKKLICGVKFGGLLHIACPTIPLEFAILTLEAPKLPTECKCKLFLVTPTLLTSSRHTVFQDWLSAVEWIST